jgi:hypothetical protein
VNRTSFANSGVTVTHLALSRGSDSSTSVLCEDVNRISISPAYSEVAVNYLALSDAHAARSRVTDSWIYADLDVSVVESRGDDTPRFRISTPSSPEQPSQYLDSSATNREWRHGLLGLPAIGARG